MSPCISNKRKIRSYGSIRIDSAFARLRDRFIDSGSDFIQAFSAADPDYCRLACGDHHPASCRCLRRLRTVSHAVHRAAALPRSQRDQQDAALEQ